MKKNCIIYLLLIALGILNSCVKKTLHDLTESQLIIEVDWTNLEGDNTVENATINIGEKFIIIEKGEQPEPFYLSLGSYDIYMYNTPPGILINNEIASISMNDQGNTIPYDYAFYSISEKLTMLPNLTTKIVLVPEKNTRQLIINLHYASEYLIESISGILFNSASSFNIKSKEEENPGNVILNLTNYVAAINIFGFVETDQSLLLEVTLVNDTISWGKTLKNTQNVSEILKDFNLDKANELTIDIYLSDDDLQEDNSENSLKTKG